MTHARFDDLTPGSERAFRLVDPLDVLQARSAAEVPAVLAAAERQASAGRWVAGFVAYEAAPGLDPTLAVRTPHDDAPYARLPLAWFGVFSAREAVAPAEPEPAPGWRTIPPWAPSVPRGTYIASVERIRELIAAGQTYQVNHTFRMRAALEDDGARVYRDLVLAQRGAFGADLGTGRYRILSASPELFFRWDHDTVTTRPMKGTAPRGRWPAEDEAAAALSASTKDRAENAMIVDLLRNDLGRVAIPGTVRADALFELERYETVWQLTSTVTARVPEDTSLASLFRALFPSGSVTGAPKVASMAIIAELEDSPRGVYTGAVGFLAPPGSGEPRAVFSVAIRTLVVDEETGMAEYGVGGGITFDSAAGAEYDEALAKARVLVERRPAFELLETLAWEPVEGFRHREEHLARLASSAAYFGFPYDEEAVRTALEKAAADAGRPARVRLTLSRDGRVRAQASEPPRASEDPVRLAIVEVDPVDASDVWLFHKTTRREGYERRRARRPDADDVLLVNTRGHVTESTIANLAVRIGSGWFTPPLADGLLAGTYRDVLVRQGRLRERSLTVADVRSADEVALVSSVRGWRPAVLLGPA